MKIFSILISFLFCVNLNAQKGKLFLSSWNDDGNADLNVPFDTYKYSKKGNLSYYISNNNSNIYLDIKTVDPRVQGKILKDGLTVWINMDRKLEKRMGIRFPIGSQNSGNHNKSKNNYAGINSKGNLIDQLSLANTIELIGFITEEVRRFPAENTGNFGGSVKFDGEGVLHYKMIMPITKLPLRNSKDGGGSMPFTLGIEYGYVPVSSKNGGGSNNRSQQSFKASSGGYRKEGSQNSARSGGSRMETLNNEADSDKNQDTSPPVLFWIKSIKLAPEN